MPVTDCTVATRVSVGVPRAPGSVVVTSPDDDAVAPIDVVGVRPFAMTLADTPPASGLLPTATIGSGSSALAAADAEVSTLNAVATASAVPVNLKLVFIVTSSLLVVRWVVHERRVHELCHRENQVDLHDLWQCIPAT
ncbi:hypothetical protein [Ralstonia solanacearum]|uniref:hypothetical protein n=1 Tax=Ralstonia pseudosolanacearum TaxID=1310165 RepID=UPI001E42D751